MRRWGLFRRAGALLAITLGTLVASAHVGTLDAFFSGMAGPYKIQVTVRPPGIVPGLAQITVRVRDAVVTRVTTQAAQWNVGSRGAPAPDVALRVPTDSALFSSQLWLMTRGSYAVNVAVEGPAGRGTVTVPLSNIATQKLGMPPALGWILAGLAIFLSFGFVSLVGASVRESVLAPGETPSSSRRGRARVAMAAAAVVLVLAISGGRAWWNGVDKAYARGLFEPLKADVSVREAGGASVLRVTISDSGYLQKQSTPIMPDHGKMMHLFLIGEAEPHALSHLHPVALDSATFESRSSGLPAGAYRYFADVVHESGFAETLSGTVRLGEPNDPSIVVPGDPDDASYSGPLEQGARQILASGATVELERPAVLRANDDVLLRFTVRDASGAVATLSPYMGMPAHAMVARDDGSVFAHLHSNGSFSMAAQQVLEAIERGDTLASIRPNMPRPRLDSTATDHASHLTADGHLEFPFAFPKAGRYIVWVQFRRGGAVETAAFITVVQ